MIEKAYLTMGNNAVASLPVKLLVPPLLRTATTGGFLAHRRVAGDARSTRKPAATPG